MKINNYAIRLIISLITVIMFSGNATAQDEPSKTINGIWVGTLVIPNNAELRMGITVSESNKASLNIIDQATGNIPIDEVIMHGDSVVFKMNGLGITISCLADLDHNRLTGEFNQHGTVFPMIFERNEKMPELNRPQLPKEPFPYTAEEVTYENRAEGILLAGTLTLPETGNKAPAVILLTGTGQQGRDQDVGGHKPFWVIADYLSRNGIAVLRIDDRGIGGSKGNFDRSTTGNFAQDALAGIAYLKTRSEINADQIGLIGHSEGGTTAAIAASISKEVAFMISLAGPGLNFEDIVIGQISDQLIINLVGDDL
jgi:alpha/beta superfamily hydrolase